MALVADRAVDLSLREDAGDAVARPTRHPRLDGWRADPGEKPLGLAGLGALPRALVTPTADASLCRGRLERAQRVVGMHVAFLLTGEAMRLRVGGAAPPALGRRSPGHVVPALGSPAGGLSQRATVPVDFADLADANFSATTAQQRLEAQRVPRSCSPRRSPWSAGRSSTARASTSAPRSGTSTVSALRAKPRCATCLADPARHHEVREGGAPQACENVPEPQTSP